MGHRARQRRLYRADRARHGRISDHQRGFGRNAESELDGIDSETALEVFLELESDIHRIAQREFVKRLGGESPILLTAADVEI